MMHDTDIARIRRAALKHYEEQAEQASFDALPLRSKVLAAVYLSIVAWAILAAVAYVIVEIVS